MSAPTLYEQTLFGEAMGYRRLERMETVASLAIIVLVAGATLYSCGERKPMSVADVAGTYRAEIKGEYVHALMVTQRDGTSEYREVNEQYPERIRAVLVVRPDGTWEYTQEAPIQSRRTGAWSLSPWPFMGPSLDSFPPRLPIRDGHTQEPTRWWPKFARTHSGRVVSLYGPPRFERVE
jgi:hypothetical protein